MKLIIILTITISYILLAGLMKAAGKSIPPIPIKNYQENFDI